MRRRILTDGLQAVKLWPLATLLPLALGAGASWAVPTRGDLRLLAVLAAFPDRPLDHDRQSFMVLMDRFVAYYREVSAGRLSIHPTIGSPAVTLPAARATYVQRPDALARDAVAAFGAAAASDPAEAEALRSADALVVFFAGPGRESHVEGGDPDDPWSNYTVISPPPGAARLGEACVIAEEEVPPFGNFGVLCHEFGHLLGLPELYAPGGLPHEGIGVWGLMGQGTWLRLGERPPHPCAWSKLRLGWVDVETIERATRGVRLPAIEEVPRVVKIPASRGRPEEYYLVENRERIGADSGLPGEGLLVWHVDETVTGFRTSQSVAAHKLLHLVEADGRNDLDRGHGAGGNRGDRTDPFQGPPPWRRRASAPVVLLGALLAAGAVLRGVRARAFPAVLCPLGAAALALAGAAWLRRGPSCGPGMPGMAPYDGSPVRAAIRNISPPGRVMSFDVWIAPSDEH